jgi:hypothetical protein
MALEDESERLCRNISRNKIIKSQKREGLSCTAAEARNIARSKLFFSVTDSMFTSTALIKKVSLLTKFRSLLRM